VPAHDERPLDETRLHTCDLPATPQRDRRIPARAWVEAPAALLALGDDLGTGREGGTPPEVSYIREIHGWLLWRAGPATHGHARYLAVAGDDVAAQESFRLLPDGTGEGAGPSGTVHTRFRTWKEDLRDHPRGSEAGGRSP